MSEENMMIHKKIAAKEVFLKTKIIILCNSIAIGGLFVVLMFWSYSQIMGGFAVVVLCLYLMYNTYRARNDYMYLKNKYNFEKSKNEDF